MAMDATSLLTSQLGAAAACAYILDTLQRWSKTPWITTHTKTINATVRGVLAAAATAGISTAWSSAADNSHVLMITIPPATVILHGLWHWFCQYAFQHGFGKVFSINDATPQAGGQ